MGLKNRQGLDIRDYWKDGIRAYMGTTFAGYPNCFMTYTPYAPTALANGTSIIEVQCDFAAAAIQKIVESSSSSAGGTTKRVKAIEALPEAEDEWARYVERQNEGTLFPLTESWWTGANIPGKKAQMLTYLGGLEAYESDIRTRLDRLEGFEVRYWDGTREQNRPLSHEMSVLAKEGLGQVPLAEHVEYRQDEKKTQGASEAADILRPAVAAT